MGRPDVVFVVWAEPTGEPDVGRLRGAALASIGVGLDCGDAWVPMDPPTERRILGSPAVADWEPGGHRITCDVIRDDFGVSYPFRAVGPMGIQIGDCVEIIERLRDAQPIPLPSDFGPHMQDALEPVLDSQAARRVPPPYDPESPRRDRLVGPEDLTLDLQPILAAQPENQSKLETLEVGVGDLFRASRETRGLPTGVGVEGILEHELDADADAPTGEWKTIGLRFPARFLVVAFRDELGVLRAAPFDDARATRDLPILDIAPNATDPALTTVVVRERAGGFRVDRQYLYALYGTTELVGGIAVPTRLSYRAATVFEPGDDFIASIFSPPRRIDSIRDVRGVRRSIDYRYARTTETPTVVGARGRLHLFVAAVNPLDPSLVPARVCAREGVRVPCFDPDDRAVAPHPVTDSQIRYALLRPLNDTGELTWVGERPVRLLGTNVASTRATGVQAGAALVTRQRGQLRFFFPSGLALTVRSVTQP